MMTEDPILDAMLRGDQEKRRIVEDAGGTFTGEEVANLLGISERDVDRQRERGRLLALAGEAPGYIYPRFQFQEGKTVDGLELVLARLKHVDPWMQMIFFTRPHERLEEKTPMEMLRCGLSEKVAQLANMFGEQGTL